MKSRAPLFTDPIPCPPPAAPCGAEATTVLLCGLWTAWLPAGSLGWLAASLEKSLAWLALGTIALIAVGRREPVSGLVSRLRIRDERWLVAAALALAIAMTASSLTVVNILAVAVLLAAVAVVRPAALGRVAGPAALAAVALAVFRLVCEGSGLGGAIANAIGRAEGLGAGLLTGRPLFIGATFGGLDFLVVMIALAIAWWRTSPVHDPRRLLYVVAGIVAAQFAYLMILAFAHDLTRLLPSVTHVAPTNETHLDVWTWSNSIHTMLPWHLPVLAAIFQSVVAVIIFHGTVATTPIVVRRQAAGLRFAPAALLIAAAACAGLAPVKPDLTGRKIVAYDDGTLNWAAEVPVLAPPGLAPRYGLLPVLVASLGGEFVVSKDLNAGDLRDASVLVVLPSASPEGAVARPMPDDVRQKILSFVRGGGGLVVAGSPESHLAAGNTALNALLESTAISLRDDTANSLTERWDGNLLSAPGATTATSRPGCCGFSFERAASLRVSWPAAPILSSRWCWNKVESDVERPNDLAYSPGSRLGDLVLAAEQSIGQGRIVVLGDASCLSNDGIPFSHMFCGPLLSSLASRDAAPSAWWRQIAALVAAVAAVALLAYRFEPIHLVVAAVALAIAVMAIHSLNDATAQLLPMSGKPAARPIVYVDGSHLEMMGRDPWRDDGIGRYMRVLASSSYLPLLAPDLSSARLKVAATLVSIAPGRGFSDGELKAVDEFVAQGGNFISLCGAPDAGPSRAMLEQFKLGIEPMPVPPWKNVPEPEPLGSFAPEGSIAGLEPGLIRFHAAWPVSCTAIGANLWPNGRVPVIAGNRRSAEAGQTFLIGDSQFALQKSLAPPPEATGAEANLAPNALFWETSLRGWFGCDAAIALEFWL